ncbi:MAG: hypothetical protein AB7R55_00365 [Gemmatimonadales bacterium]
MRSRSVAGGSVGTTVATLLVAGPQLASAQAVSQADVQIQALTVARRASPSGVATATRAVPRARGSTGATLAPVDAIDVTVTVFSNNDDDAQAVQLRIFLPPESRPLIDPGRPRPRVRS